MPRQSYAFRIAGLEPTSDPAWHVAGDAAHRAFWKAVVGFVLVEKDSELAGGYDRFGRRMKRIRESTRKKGRWRSHTGEGDPNAAPLDPARALSRTRSLFTGRAHADHAEFFWKFDEVSGKPWGVVLGYHRAGNPSRNLPVRDVIGLSPVSLRRVKAKADEWWANYRAGRAHGYLAGEATLVIPPPSGRPKIERPVPPRPAAGARFDIEHFTFGVGGSEDQTKKAIAEGRFSGFSKLTKPPTAPSPAPAPPVPPKPPASGRPKPAPFVHAPRIVPGRPRVPNLVTVTPAPLPKIGEKIPQKPVPGPAPIRLPDVKPPPTPGVDIAAFSAKLKAIVASVGEEGRYYDNKVFINHAHRAYDKTHGPITLEEFKRLLIQSLQSGHTVLSRADLVEAMNAADLRASLTLHPGGAEFNFIRTD